MPIEIPKQDKSEIAKDVETIKGIFGTVEKGIDVLENMLNRLIDLAKTNPLWGVVLGLLVVDLASHKANILKWTHQETYCTDCNFFVDTYKYITGQHISHTLTTQEVGGILSSGGALLITGTIVAGFGIAGAGEIIQDISNITKLTGTAQSAGDIIKPSITTLVESDSKTPTIDVSKK